MSFIFRVLAVGAFLGLGATSQAGTITIDTFTAPLEDVAVERLQLGSRPTPPGQVGTIRTAVALTRTPDAFSAAFAEHAFAGTLFPVVEITIVEDSGQQSVWTLKDAQVVGITQTDTTDDRTREVVSMSWDLISVQVTP